MNKRILVIDDQKNILADYESILCPGTAADEHRLSLTRAADELLGMKKTDKIEEVYEVTTASQGEEGYKLVCQAVEQDKPFAVAFIDIRMPPGWDGMKTASEIRKVDKNIEIVIVTAYSDRDRQEIVKTVGTPEKLLYLKKPFDIEEIKQLALSLTEKWRLQRKEKRRRQAFHEPA
ncbi:MAG: response regulator [Deltaproteobacteria bacterium]|nr:response regulator [Deltaproteobacteria bacterium]